MTRKERLQTAKKYAVFYGIGKENELRNFDLVIVEPAGQTPDSIEALKKNRILVIAYISFMEVNQDMAEYNLLKEEDFLSDQGNRLQNNEYHNDLVDIRSKRWKSLLLQKITKLLLSMGYDGVFLDTIGDICFPIIPQCQREALIHTSVEFLSDVKKRFPDHLIIQNNGIEHLLSYTAEYIDSVCWENPPFGASMSHKWFKKLLMNFEQTVKANLLKALILNAAEGSIVDSLSIDWEITENISIQKDFLYYKAPNGYLEIS